MDEKQEADQTSWAELVLSTPSDTCIIKICGTDLKTEPVLNLEAWQKIIIVLWLIYAKVESSPTMTSAGNWVLHQRSAFLSLSDTFFGQCICGLGRQHLYVDPRQESGLFSSWYVVSWLLCNVSKVMLPNGWDTISWAWMWTKLKLHYLVLGALLWALTLKLSILSLWCIKLALRLATWGHSAIRLFFNSQCKSLIRAHRLLMRREKKTQKLLTTRKEKQWLQAMDFYISSTIKCSTLIFQFFCSERHLQNCRKNIMSLNS